MTLPRATQLGGTEASVTLTLTYEARFLRRRALTCDDGTEILVDLAQTTSLNHGDLLLCDTGLTARIIAAKEPLLAINATNLTELAWHIGNRHTPMMIEDTRLLIQPDHVLHDLMHRLGAQLSDITAPFTPLGGAYGHGRTHAHAH